MRAYKVFRVMDGELYSAFEGQETCQYKAIKPERKLHYKVGELMVDPKPDPGCTGLMILLEKDKAYKFFSECYRHTHFSLHRVSTKEKPRQEVFGLTDSFSAAEVDSLTVGVKIADNRRLKEHE